MQLWNGFGTGPFCQTKNSGQLPRGLISSSVWWVDGGSGAQQPNAQTHNNTCCHTQTHNNIWGAHTSQMSLSSVRTLGEKELQTKWSDVSGLPDTSDRWIGKRWKEVSTSSVVAVLHDADCMKLDCTLSSDPPAHTFCTLSVYINYADKSPLNVVLSLTCRNLLLRLLWAACVSQQWVRAARKACWFAYCRSTSWCSLAYCEKHFVERSAKPHAYLCLMRLCWK